MPTFMGTATSTSPEIFTYTFSNLAPGTRITLLLDWQETGFGFSPETRADTIAVSYVQYYTVVAGVRGPDRFYPYTLDGGGPLIAGAIYGISAKGISASYTNFFQDNLENAVDPLYSYNYLTEQYTIMTWELGSGITGVAPVPGISEGYTTYATFLGTVEITISASQNTLPDGSIGSGRFLLTTENPNNLIRQQRWGDNWLDAPAEFFTSNDDVVDFNNLTDDQKLKLDLLEGPIIDVNFADSGDDLVTLPSPANRALRAGKLFDHVSLFDGGDGEDTINGALGDDHFSGGKGNDVLKGKGGNDTIFGSQYTDFLFGSLGDDADYIEGGDDDDIIIGGIGDDTVDGGQGNDVLVGGVSYLTSLGDLLSERGKHLYSDEDIAYFGGSRDNYRITEMPGGWLRLVYTGSEEGLKGTDFVRDIEYLDFSGARYETRFDGNSFLDLTHVSSGDSTHLLSGDKAIVNNIANGFAWDKLPGDGNITTISYSFAQSEASFAEGYWAETWGGHSIGQFLPFDYNSLRSAVKAIFAYLESVANLRFVELEEEGDPFSPSTGVGTIRFVGFYDLGDDFGVANRPGTARAGDIALSQQFVGSSFHQGTRSFQVLAHEIGHALGLDHSFPDQWNASFQHNSLMSYMVETRGFRPVDVHVIQATYGAAAGSSLDEIGPLLDTVQFDSTLWSSDPTLLLDFSGLVAKSADVNLREGSLSRITSLITDPLSGSAFLSIAYGTRVFNANGGFQSDRIVGNDLPNALDGREGDDELNGGGGDDQLFGGSGIDRAIYAGARESYSIRRISEGVYEITDNRFLSPEGKDLLFDIEFVWFDGVAYELKWIVPQPESGSSGNDVFRAIVPNSTFDGRSGRDAVIYENNRTIYQVARQDDGVIVVSGPTGSDTLISIERVEFLDGALVFDPVGMPISLAGTLKNQAYQPMDSAALVYRLYSAAFARTPDEAGFIYWAERVLTGDINAELLAKQFRLAPEFTEKYGSNLSDIQYADKLYSNVLQRPSDLVGLEFWAYHLTSGYYSRDQLMAAFAVSPENIQHTASDISNGFWVL